ncbi:MAG TPA: nickel-dependent lactate racemase [Polyangia bacterium]
MEVHLQYGRHGTRVQIPSQRVRVIEPTFVPGLPDEAGAFLEAVRRPMGTRPLRDLVAADETVAIVIPDITRPLPSSRLLPWLLAELAHVAPTNITIVNGTGSHRANTTAELTEMVGADVLAKVRVVNHVAADLTTLAPAGQLPDGHPVFFARDYVNADRRIVLGFIEPHFMAGFSGGYKGVFPGIADLASIQHYHRASVIADPRSTWGILEGNPTQDQIRAGGSLLPVDFLLNVTLNRSRAITGFFCGDVRTAHEAGCAFVKTTTMVACDRAYPIVITTNSGHPLDQNLYQTVKGMHAAMQIVEPGGLIITASSCSEGFPEHGNFKSLLFGATSPQALLDKITAKGFSMHDQWQAQLLATIAVRADLALKSELPADDVRRAHIEPIADVGARVQAELQRRGDVPIAVLPEGPMTIPYIA